jgi:hypothetical protein
MNDEQIIEAKTNEIRRLHKVCLAKDEMIRKSITEFERLFSLRGDYSDIDLLLISELKDSLG